MVPPGDSGQRSEVRSSAGGTSAQTTECCEKDVVARERGCFQPPLPDSTVAATDSQSK